MKTLALKAGNVGAWPTARSFYLGAIMVMKLGEVNTGVLGSRDAIHIATIMVRSYEDVRPGDKVVFDDSYFIAVSKAVGEYHAIVDPFLAEIKLGDAFLVFVKPDFINNLTHNYKVEIPGYDDHGEAPYDDYDSCKQMGCS